MRHAPSVTVDPSPKRQRGVFVQAAEGPVACALGSVRESTHKADADPCPAAVGLTLPDSS